MHGRYDLFGGRPGSAQDLCEQSTLPGYNCSAVDDDLELPLPTLLELDGGLQSIVDEGSETRCLFGGRASGLAVDDSYIHSQNCSSSPLPQTNNPGRIW